MYWFLVHGSKRKKKRKPFALAKSSNATSIEDLCWNIISILKLDWNPIVWALACSPRRDVTRRQEWEKSLGQKICIQRGLGSKRSNADSSNKLTIQSRIRLKRKEKKLSFVPLFYYGWQCRLPQCIVGIPSVSEYLQVLKSIHETKTHCVRSLKTGRRFSQPRSRAKKTQRLQDSSVLFPLLLCFCSGSRERDTIVDVRPDTTWVVVPQITND